MCLQQLYVTVIVSGKNEFTLTAVEEGHCMKHSASAEKSSHSTSLAVTPRYCYNIRTHPWASIQSYVHKNTHTMPITLISEYITLNICKWPKNCTKTPQQQCMTSRHQSLIISEKWYSTPTWMCSVISCWYAQQMTHCSKQCITIPYWQIPPPWQVANIVAKNSVKL